MEKSETSNTLVDFLKIFIIPVLVNKAFMLYFGLKLSEFPGEGYGYGLAASIIVLFVTIGRFIWKYRNVEDP